MSRRPTAVTRRRSWRSWSGRAAGGALRSVRAGRRGGRRAGTAAVGAAGAAVAVLRARATGRRQGGRLTGDIYLILPRHEPWRVRATSRSVARQTLPRHRSTLRSSPRHPSRCATMHGAAQAFRRAREIGIGKSVSFEK